ncbi:MAG: precorrin-8X methylmutase [Clostridia bacterium]|nr:precorrin-8X methylmutase [Clostridia bacterium]
MYSMPLTKKGDRARMGRKLRPTGGYRSESVLRVIERVVRETGDASLGQSLHFTPGVVERVLRELALGCALVADSNLICAGLDGEAAGRLSLEPQCFMDNPAVIGAAAHRRVTRAEVAMDRALSLDGPKLLIVGSAPMALNRLLQLNQRAPLRETVVVAAASGFASAVELKERLWESGLPCIVARGRKGGAGAAIALANALLAAAAQLS